MRMKPKATADTNKDKNRPLVLHAAESRNISGKAGLYIHIPFCLKKCPYCSFYSITDLVLKSRFLESLLKEMDQYRNTPLIFDSIYFGGGTPSLLSFREIFPVLDKIHKLFRVQDNVEITLEVNPGTVDKKILKEYAAIGINRINIGVQSFDDGNLRFLGRIHCSKEARLAIEAARSSGFDNTGIDLIYGMDGQNTKKWKKDLETALAFSPEHLSCYMLSYEKNTPFYEARKTGGIQPLNDNLPGALFSFTWRFLTANGYIPYEISNFSRARGNDAETFRSRHNQKYWHFAPYIGLGPSAHSYLEPVRFWNHSSVNHYIRLIESGHPAVESSETLSMEQQFIESIFLGLRTTEGIALEDIEQKFGAGFQRIFSAPLKKLGQRKWVNLTHGRCALTPQGMRFCDSICDYLLYHVESALISKPI